MIDRRDDRRHIVITKLRMAGKGKTLVRVRLGIRKAARIAAHIFATALAVDWNRVMNQGFNRVFHQEVGQAISFGAPHNEQMVNMTLRENWR